MIGWNDINKSLIEGVGMSELSDVDFRIGASEFAVMLTEDSISDSFKVCFV